MKCSSTQLRCSLRRNISAGHSQNLGKTLLTVSVNQVNESQCLDRQMTADKQKVLEEQKCLEHQLCVARNWGQTYTRNLHKVFQPRTSPAAELENFINDLAGAN